uniref:Periostin n=1 Tax=Gallus gallus TaxID=9031 RepID=A0A8V0XF50_CHICK
MKIFLLFTFSTFFLSAFEQAAASAHYDKILTHSRIRARDQGPNVCALQQVMGTKKKYFSTCRNWYQGSICGKKATVLYECCPGYMKMDGMRGCPAVAPIDHVYGTLGIVGATSTQQYSDMSKLREEIEGRGSFTFFAPSNEAWEQLSSEIHRNLIDNVNIELYNALHHHMVNKRMLTKDLKNGMTLVSMYNGQKLLINHYPNGVVTVNCARIIHGNQIATNGVVHVIDRVLTAVGNTIQDFIEVEDDLSSLRAAAITSDVLDTLGRPGYYTLFAPTNEAFERLPRGILERIMGDKVASEALVKFHILNTLQCSEAIMGGAVYETLEGNTLEVGCDGETLTVNGVKMVKRKDIVTSNGVIHLIDRVLIPDSAKQVIELGGAQQTTFTDLVTQLGLASSLRPEGQYTLLVPQNRAFSDDTLQMDQRLLKTILQNHIIKVKIGLNELYNGQELETIGGKLLRVFVYRTAVCVENSCMVRGSKEGRNGFIHVFRQIIKPAEKSLHEMLRNDKHLATDCCKIYSTAGLRNKVFFIQPCNANLTFNVYILMFWFVLFLISLITFVLYQVNDTLLVNDLKSREPDLMATNGVIHVIDKLLYPADLPVGNDQLLTILKKLIKYIQIKPHGILCIFLWLFITCCFFLHVTDPSITQLTKIIEGEPEFKIVREGETITKVIHGEPIIKTYTKIIDGRPVEVTEKKVTEERIIQGPEIKYTRITAGGTDNEENLKRLLEEEVTKVTKFIEGDAHLLEDEEIKRLLQGAGTEYTKVTKVIEGEPQIIEREIKKVHLEG